MPRDSKCPFWDGDLWPFQRSSDLQLRDEKVTLNHLVYIHIFYRIPWEYILPTWMVDFNGNISEYVIPTDPMGYEKHIEFETSGYFFFEMFLKTNFVVIPSCPLFLVP